MIDGASVLDALGEPNRRLLLELLRRGGESTVTELVAASGLRQPQVSKHLKVLAGAALVSVRADGRHRHYSLDGRGLQAAHDWFASFEDVWQARFDTLDQLVSADPAIDPPSTDPPSTDPPSTDPPSTDPPSTDPPSTDPPSPEEPRP